MLTDLVDIVLKSKYKIDSGTLYCDEISVDTKSIKECIDFLVSNEAMENTNYVNEIGNRINLELTLVKLNAIGFFESRDTFILRNKYCEPLNPYYLLDLKSYSIDNHQFIINYRIILNSIKSIELISKHTYTEIDLKTSIIVSEEQSLVVPISYNVNVCEITESNLYEKLSDTINVFNEAISEKKLLFLNQLIALLKPVNELERFVFFVTNIYSYYEKSINSYQYYLRDFSYNKLKVELDSKALEFAQKIQTVINDSQVKLITIPTAFVLIVATFDFEKIISAKNISTIISSFIFSVLIQLFLNNQRSTLRFIKQNVDDYKNTFMEKTIEENSNRFNLVEIEFKKQELRLKIIELILWSIPSGLFCFSIYLQYHFESIVFIYLFIVVIHAFFRFKWDN